MTDWVQAFQNHPVHEQLRAFQSVLAEIEGDTEDEPSPEVIEAIERLKQIANQTEKLLSTLDPFLIPRGVLDNINSYLVQSVSYCNQYKGDRNPGHFENANNQADAILVQLGSLLSVRSKEELEGLGEAIISFRRSVGQYHRQVNDDRLGLRAEIEAADGEMKKLSGEIKAQQARLDEVVSEFQRQFSDSEERRRSDFANSEKDQEDRFKKLQEELATEFRILLDEHQARAEEHLDSFWCEMGRSGG